MTLAESASVISVVQRRPLKADNAKLYSYIAFFEGCNAVRRNPLISLKRGLRCGVKFWSEPKLKRGRHSEKALSALQVSRPRLLAATRMTMVLGVDPSGAKRWLLRIVVQGRRRDIGLGGTELVRLAEETRSLS